MMHGSENAKIVILYFQTQRRVDRDDEDDDDVDDGNNNNNNTFLS